MVVMMDFAEPDRQRLSCRDCVHFEDDPLRLEAELPNIGILSSVSGSSRGNAGICRALDRFHDPVPAADCPEFAVISPGSPAK
jgi:hypothetical protein